jgi:hypothetical protein
MLLPGGRRDEDRGGRRPQLDPDGDDVARDMLADAFIRAVLLDRGVTG